MRLRTLGILTALVLAACGGPADADREMAAKLVQRGKTELGASQFTSASATFARAKDFDAANEEARFGHAISEILVFYEQMSLIVRAAGFGDLVPAAARPGDGTADEAEMYNRIVLDVLAPLRDNLTAAADELDTVRGADFEFRIGSLPVVWSNDVILELGGTWRDGDARFVGGLAHGTAALLEFALAHELKFDLFDVLDYFTAYTGSFEEFDFTAPQLVNVVVHVFASNEDFLVLGGRDADLDGEIDGPAGMARARRHVQTFAEDWAGMREIVAQRPGMLRSGTPLSGTLAVLELRDALVVKENAGGAPEYGVLSVPVTEGFEAGLRALAANLGGGGERVGFADHLVPIVSVVAVSVVGVVTQLDLDLSDSVKDVLALVKKPDTVAGLINGVIPDVIAFDPGAYFDEPVGIREFVPRWRDDAGVPPNERSFFLEWECAYAEDATAPAGSTGNLLHYQADDETAKGYHFTCPAKSAVDAAHFPSRATDAAVFAQYDIEPIESDGIAGGLPYVVFGDPDFGRMLYMKADAKVIAGENPVGRGSFRLADQRALNAFVQQVYADLGL